jgi:hypothetical protein
MRPEVARDALLATHGGLSLERCAVLYHISPMALYRLVCALGSQSLVTVLTRCELPLPVYFLADEKHSRCLTDKVYLPTIVSGRIRPKYSEGVIRCQKYRWGVASLAIEKSEAIEKPYHIALSPCLASGDYRLQQHTETGNCRSNYCRKINALCTCGTS